MGTILGTVGSVVLGGVVAAVTVIGVITSQTSPSGETPANVNQPVIQYGTTN